MEELGLKITSKANLKVVEFLDVVFDLQSDTYRPFLKPGDRPLYVNKQSNHPPSILKNIPLAINKRLCDISSSKEVFDQAVPLYQTALSQAGYDHKLEYSEPPKVVKRKRKKVGMSKKKSPLAVKLKGDEQGTKADKLQHLVRDVIFYIGLKKMLDEHISL